MYIKRIYNNNVAMVDDAGTECPAGAIARGDVALSLIR